MALRPENTKPTRLQQAANELLAALPGMSYQELLKLWPAYFQVPPFSTKRAILIPALAYCVQEKAFGGLSRGALSRLQAVAQAQSEGRRPTIVPQKPKVRPGTRLLRAWRGEVHEVTVMDEGFVYQGQNFKSLSEIARTITGVQWSGPVFFGLKKSQERRQERIRATRKIAP